MPRLNQKSERLRAAIRRTEQAEQRADDAEHHALELDATGDPRVIIEHVARRLQRLTHADQICVSFGSLWLKVALLVLAHNLKFRNLSC